jgi:hypothetical protein
MPIAFPKKNLDKKKSNLFLIPLGISNKDSKNVGRLVKIELTTTSGSP